MKTDYPQALDYAKNLIENNPKYFTGQPMTAVILAQAFIQFEKAVNDWNYGQQSVNVFNNPMQAAATKMNNPVYKFLKLDQ